MKNFYKLISRRNLYKNARPGSRLYYAQAKSNGRSNLTYLCSIISARSTVTSADVKAVLDSLVYVLSTELASGRIVELGEFGNFRVTIGSIGTETPEAFTKACLRRPKIIFHPGKELRDLLKTLRFERYPTPGK
ncbi:MAG: HU family DNA-binding protein [Tannerellaceae bacterium]|nr:HU family DNA-binding protein [Tannerellaceae bacterium]